MKPVGRKPGVPCFRLQSIRAFPEGLEGLGARVEVHGQDKERHLMPLYEHVFRTATAHHGQILEAIRAQDGDAAAHLMREHLDFTVADLEKIAKST